MRCINEYNLIYGTACILGAGIGRGLGLIYNKNYIGIPLIVSSLYFYTFFIKYVDKYDMDVSLYNAIINNSLKDVKKYLNYGANPNKIFANTKSSAISLSISISNKEIVKELLKNDAIVPDNYFIHRVYIKNIIYKKYISVLLQKKFLNKDLVRHTWEYL